MSKIEEVRSAMVAAMTLRFLDPFGSGKLVLFQVTYDKVGSAAMCSGDVC